MSCAVVRYPSVRSLALSVIRGIVEEYDLMGVGDIDCRAVQRQLDAGCHQIAGRQHIRLARVGPEIQGEIHRGRGQFCHVHPRAWIAQDSVDVREHPFDRLTCLFDRVGITDADGKSGTPDAVGRADEDGARIHVHVRDRDRFAVVGSQAGRTGVDFFDRALMLAGANLITQPERLSPQQEEAGQKVLQNILEGEADGDRGDAETGHEIAWFEGRKNDDRGNEQPKDGDGGGGQPTEQFRERGMQFGAPTCRHDRTLEDASGDDEQPEDEQSDQNQRQTVEDLIPETRQGLPGSGRIRIVIGDSDARWHTLSFTETFHPALHPIRMPKGRRRGSRLGSSRSCAKSTAGTNIAPAGSAMMQPDRKPAPRWPPDEPLERRHLWNIQPVVDLLFIFAAGALLWFVYDLRGVFMPVLLALALAYLVNPVVTWLEKRWSVPRPTTVTMLLVLLVLAAAAFLAWLGPLLVTQTQQLARKTPQYLQTLAERYGVQATGLSNTIMAWASGFQDDPISLLQRVFQPVFAGTGQALGFIGAVIGTTTYFAITAMLMPIYFFVFAWRFERIAASVTPLIPASRRGTTMDILRKMDEAVTGFFRGRVLIAVITGVMYAVGWAWTDVPYWFLLGAGTGLLSIIPYVSVIGWPLALLLKYLDAAANAGAAVDWVSVALVPSIPYLVVQFLESWWLTPWIQGRTNDLSAVTVIIVVLIGGAVGGFLGLLLSIPLAACVKILFQELVLPRWEAWAARR